MSTHAPATAESIVVEYELPGPPAKVWRALTEPELLARWLMNNDFQPVVGHRFTFRAQPVAGWDGVVQCEVLEVEEHRRLSYSWRGGSEQHRIDTVVTWTLVESGPGKTLLRLEHSGFTPRDVMSLQGLGKGWRGKIRERLQEVTVELG